MMMIIKSVNESKPSMRINQISAIAKCVRVIVPPVTNRDEAFCTRFCRVFSMGREMCIDGPISARLYLYFNEMPPQFGHFLFELLIKPEVYRCPVTRHDEAKRLKSVTVEANHFDIGRLHKHWYTLLYSHLHYPHSYWY